MILNEDLTEIRYNSEWYNGCGMDGFHDCFESK